MISSSITIQTSKEVLESKYRATNKIALTDQRLQHIQTSTGEKLRQHVRRYWVMGETGSPQFVMASNPLSTASAVICVIVLVINLVTVFNTQFQPDGIKEQLFDSKNLDGTPYKWSITMIFVTQSVGVVKYWIQTLLEWKKSPVLFLSSNRRTKSLVYNSKNIFLSFFIGFQKVIVILCKLIWLTVTIVPVLAVGFFTTLTSRTDDIDEDLSKYVLQIDNGKELAEKTLKGITKSVDSFISKVEKGQNNILLELLDKFTEFEGVKIFDTDQVQSLLPTDLVNSWSLPIVTLTCIAVSIPNSRDRVESLLRSVGEGLSFTHLVEESLNCSSEYVNLRKASMSLWHEVEYKCKWLDNPLAKDVFDGKEATEIVKWFSDKAKEIVTEIKDSTSDGELVENPPGKLIAANSMYRITQTILLRFQSNTEPITKKRLFSHLNGMIADIFCACFTNLPRVITMRCHESVIEKREASVRVAAKLLGKTTKIIEKLEECDKVPSMDDDTMAYIDEWRLYMKQSIP
uniref:Uncharacterized protein n=1 Tax=Helianthus annuus TaxID=4232 RepID=A0A251S6Y8_HELAN